MRRGLRAQSPPEVIPGRVSVQRSLVESCNGVRSHICLLYPQHLQVPFPP